jgi:hypothetical protein
MLTFDDFRSSVSNKTPPDGLPVLLRALWFDAKGDWNAAHDLAQEVNTADGAWVHAYLHRKEGDLGNAGYWYQRAGRKLPSYSLDREWEELIKSLGVT